MDVLSDILSVARLGTPVVGQSELLAPWGLEVGSNAKAAVHVVQRGVCWMRLNGEPGAQRLIQGDVVLVARGLTHWLTDDPGTPAEPYESALERMRLRIADRPSSSPTTLLLCAEYEFDQEGVHPMLSLLPKVIHLRGDQTREDASLQPLIQLLLREAKGQRTGSEIVVPRLVDTLLVFVIRDWLSRQPATDDGWFGALQDTQVGNALSLIHTRPERNWTVGELASHTAMSRATFARRFTALVGEPPLAYATRWRMSLAAKLLRATNDPIDEVAARVGYSSTTAFGKAFRRHLGMTPGRCRASAQARRLPPG